MLQWRGFGKLRDVSVNFAVQVPTVAPVSAPRPRLVSNHKHASIVFFCAFSETTTHRTESRVDTSASGERKKGVGQLARCGQVKSLKGATGLLQENVSRDDIRLLVQEKILFRCNDAHT